MRFFIGGFIVAVTLCAFPIVGAAVLVLAIGAAVVRK